VASGPTLVGAITNTFLADTAPVTGLMALVSSGLWVGKVPEKYANPVVCLTHNGEVPQYNTEPTYYELGQVSFVVVAEGCANCEALAQRVKNVFDPDINRVQSIDITGAHVEYFRRTNYLLAESEQRGPNQVPVFTVILPYESWVDRTLPTKPLP
jgi:hypothetical protein